jgi:plasmid maintenance system antidote protein VapI
VKTRYIKNCGLFLRKRGAELGLKLPEVANRIGMQPENLRKVYDGRRNITPFLAVKLERVLQVPAEEILRLKYADELELVRNAERFCNS